MSMIDFAVVEGGLTSAVELAAVGTPFMFVPLQGHIEQKMEVTPKLERLEIGTQLSFDELTPEKLGRAFAEALKSFHVTPRANLPANSVDVTAQMILKFL